MCIVLKQTKQKARKAFSCDACYWIRECGNWGWLTFSELRIVAKAKQREWKIHPGDEYIYQFLVDGSDRWSFRAIPEIHDICIRHDLYPEC